MLADGGFEGGTPNPFWNEGSTNFGTPLCDASCGLNGAHGGNWWAWFGGISTADEVGFVAQEVTIPSGDSAELRFWLEIPVANTPGFLDVSLGGDVVFSVTEADADSYPVYTEVVVDVSSYADGGTYELRFEGGSTAGEVTNFFVDDVSLEVDPNGAGGCDSPVDIPWLSTDPDAGTTPPGESVAVDVTADASDLAPGEFTALLCVTTNDPIAPLVEVEVNLTVTEIGDDPVIDVDPESLESTLPPGGTETHDLTISNLGGGTLEWEVTEEGSTVGRVLHPSGQATLPSTLPAPVQ